MPVLQSIETGRLEDGNRSIADKIIKRLHDLDLSVESNQGRWVWELLQNAKDSIAEDDRKVVVQIEMNINNICFRHNGTHFTEKDIRGLINQISSKEIEVGEVRKKTGRFGTGFLTTHLLSKIVQVESIVKLENGDFYKFSFPLDREGNTTPILVPKIEQAWQSFYQSAEKIQYYDINKTNTSFKYYLNDDKQKEIARIGLDEFIKLIHYVLVFVPEISKVEIIDNTKNTKILFETNYDYQEEYITQIKKKENDNENIVWVLSSANDLLSIATELEMTNKGLAVKNIEAIPKIFCDFPLIGTENFHFPIVVNSFDFTPLTERDGIWLKGNDEKVEVRKNKDLMEATLSLFEEIVSTVAEKKYLNLYNLAETKTPSIDERYFDKNWFETYVQKPLRTIILKSPFITTKEGEFEVVCDVYFPDPNASEKDREKIWTLSNALGVNTLPIEDHIDYWANILWDDFKICNISDLVRDLKTKENVSTLQDCLQTTELLTFKWLNDFISFILKMNGGVSIFNDYEILPNQNGEFKKRKELSLDEINDNNLKIILNLLGNNWYNQLLHQDIFFEDCYGTLNKQDIANAITKILDNNNPKDEKEIQAIRLLSEWFDNNSHDGKEFFEKLYRNRAKLFMDTIEDKESLHKIMKSKTPLSELAKLVITIENDPEILKIIARRKQEQQEEQDRNIIGENIEKILFEAFEDYGITVKKVITGKDLVISLNGTSINYDIEVKSTTQKNYVSLTPTQANTAINNSERYSLCVVYKNPIEVIDKEYVKREAKFINKIGDLLRPKVLEVNQFENNKNEISYTNENIDLIFENNLDYKYRVSNAIWNYGFSIEEYVDLIKQK